LVGLIRGEHRRVIGAYECDIPLHQDMRKNEVKLLAPAQIFSIDSGRPDD